jgi:hypothetical protein
MRVRCDGIAGQLGYTSEPDGKHVYGPDDYYSKWSTPAFEDDLALAWKAAELFGDCVELRRIRGAGPYAARLTNSGLYHFADAPAQALCRAIVATRRMLPSTDPELDEEPQ